MMIRKTLLTIAWKVIEPLYVRIDRIVMKEEIKYITKKLFPAIPNDEDTCYIKVAENILNRITYGETQITFKTWADTERYIVIEIGEIEFARKILTIVAFYKKIAEDVGIIDDVDIIEEEKA